jgi:NRPS condensation-like uncharacterized protein
MEATLNVNVITRRNKQPPFKPRILRQRNHVAATFQTINKSVIAVSAQRNTEGTPKQEEARKDKPTCNGQEQKHTFDTAQFRSLVARNGTDMTIGNTAVHETLLHCDLLK